MTSTYLTEYKTAESRIEIYLAKAINRARLGYSESATNQLIKAEDFVSKLPEPKLDEHRQHYDSTVSHLIDLICDTRIEVNRFLGESG